MKKLHLICNAHIDPVWHWTYDEGISAALSTFKAACDLLDEYDYVFCHNESLLYEAVEKNCPELFERIKKFVKEGRWKIMGGWYIQPDCLIPNGESFVRQIATGKKYFKEKFGVEPEIALNFDSFGHSIGLVQILAKNGYKGYASSRPFKWSMPYPDGKFYHWTAPSGDSVIYCNFGPYGSLLGDAVGKIKRNMPYEDVDGLLWGVGNHGGGASRKDLKEISEFSIEGTEIIHSSLEDLYNDNIAVKETIDHSLVTCMAGCYTSMAKIKKAHRNAESDLYATEKMMAVASLCGKKFDLSDLETAQKKLLLSEFHDILPGSCVEDGEENGLELLRTCSSIVKDYRTNAFMHLCLGDSPAKTGEYPIYVFNPMPYEITAPLEAEYMLANQNWSDDFLVPKVYLGDKEIPSQQIKENSNMNLDWRKRIAFTAKLKPLSVTRFSVFHEPQTRKLYNFDYPAVPAKILDVTANSPLLGKSLALELFEDTADPWGGQKTDIVGIGKNPVDFDLMTEKECQAFLNSTDAITPIHQTEDGDVLKTVEGFYKKNDSKAVIEYKKYKEFPFIDVKVSVEFVEKDKALKLRVPLPDGVVLGDGPFIIEEKPIEHEISFQKWVGVKQKDGKVFAIINDRVHGAKVDGGYIHLTLLRAPAYCAHPLPIDSEGTIPGSRKLVPTDRYIPRIECGKYTFNFRIMTGTVEEVTAMSELFNQKPYAINVFPIGSGEKRVDIHTDKEVIMPAFKISDDGGYVFRFFNPEMKDKTFTLWVDKANVTITMHKAEVVSVRYNNGKFEVLHDKMPV